MTESFRSQFRALQRFFLPIGVLLTAWILLMIWLTPEPEHWAGYVIDGSSFEGCYRSADNNAILKLDANRLIAEDGSKITFSNFIRTPKTELIVIDPKSRFIYDPATKTFREVGPWPEGGSRVMQIGKARSVFANSNRSDEMLVPISDSGRMWLVKSSC